MLEGNTGHLCAHLLPEGALGAAHGAALIRGLNPLSLYIVII
jgi:hypothetical protein